MHIKPWKRADVWGVGGGPVVQESWQPAVSALAGPDLTKTIQKLCLLLTLQVCLLGFLNFDMSNVMNKHLFRELRIFPQWVFKQVLFSRDSSLYFDLQRSKDIWHCPAAKILQTSIPIRVGVVYNSVFIESSTRIWILLQILCIHHSISVKLRHPSICGYFQSSAERAERHTAACVMAMLMCTTYLHNYISIHYLHIYIYISTHRGLCSGDVNAHHNLQF